MALKISVQLVVEHGIQNIQMMEDSHLVIDWMRLKKSPRNIWLKPSYEELIVIVWTQSIRLHSSHNREWNQLVDQLSKDGFQLGPHLWHLWVSNKEGQAKINPRPFLHTINLSITIQSYTKQRKTTYLLYWIIDI